MMLKSILQKRQKAQPIELLSLHIPKTAGTSFYRTLQSVYGVRGVGRFELIKEKPFYNSEPFDRNRVESDIRVIHGHFTPSSVERYLGGLDAPMITWVRNPVDRVLSNYFYLKKILSSIVNEEQNNLHILEKLERTLLEFAHAEINRDRMAKFTDGMALDDFFFVGIVEQYDRDLEYLARRLKWTNYSSSRDNATRLNKKEVSADIRREIENLNQRDMALYESALELASKRILL